MIIILIADFWNVILAFSVHTVYLIRKKFNCCKDTENKLEDESSLAEFCDISL